MISRYGRDRGLGRYLAGATAARAGDEMSGPALLLLGFAVTGKPSAGSELLASLTIAAAAGGPLFGALLDRSRRPDRLLAATLAAYAIGIIAIATTVGRLPISVVVLIALAAGLFNPAVAGGWTAQLPRIVTGRELDRGSALDALTYSAASLAGPALAALLAASFGARPAVITAATLVALAGPAALWLSRYPPPARGPVPAPHRQVAAGFAAILTRRLLRRATLTSVISFTGVGMFLVCCPVLGADRLGTSARGALLISAMAAASLTANAILTRRAWRGEPDVRILIGTLMLGAGMAAAAVAPGWFTLAAVAIGGAGEGPQLTALFAVRHRESPEHMRGQIFTTAASLKIAGMAAGAALAGPLASRSVTGCLLLAGGVELAAAVSYLLISVNHGLRTGWLRTAARHHTFHRKGQRKAEVAPMSDGFSVNLTALEQASAGVDGTLNQVDQLSVSAISHDPAHLGHPVLASTLADFLDRWQRGVDSLVQDGTAIAGKLRTSVAAYREAERNAVDHIGQVNGELSGLGPDPGIR
jgi:MFS family permease